MTQATKILDEIRRHRQNGPAEHQFVAVFDLDSTLFNVTPRTQQILRDFVTDPEMRRQFAEECEILRQAQVAHSDWGLKPLVERSGFSRSSPQFFDTLRAHWRKSFFSNQYLHLDQPYEGAVEYVHAVHGAGLDIIYLTGRDVARMGPGTLSSLQQWGFPCDHEKSTLALKPNQEDDDAEFKRAYIEALVSRYATIWLFENEPVNLALVEQHHPQVKIVFVDKVHSGRAQPYEHWVRISSFKVTP